MRRLIVVPAALVATVLAAAGLSACASQSPTPGLSVQAAPGTYRATGTVLENRQHGPQLCHIVQTSLPPQCGGIDLIGWDWDAVEGEESASGTTWGRYQVTGTWDGTRLTLTEPPGPPPVDEAPDFVDFTTPCPEPPGGWQVIDPSRTNDDTFNETVAAANQRADFAGLWIDQPVRPPQPGAPDNDPTNLILNVRVTGDVAEAERDLREIWGGALCVTAAQYTQAELVTIQSEIGDESQAIGLLTSSVDSVNGFVTVMVVADDGTLQARYDTRYGPGVVRVTSWLERVSE